MPQPPCDGPGITFRASFILQPIDPAFKKKRESLIRFVHKAERGGRFFVLQNIVRYMIPCIQKNT